MDHLVPTEILVTEDSCLHNGGIKLHNLVGPRIRRIRVQKCWSQDRLAEALQRAGLDKSREAIARIEAQLVYVSDFQLLFIARVLGVGLLDLYPTIGPEDNLYDVVTELRKPRKYATPNHRRRKTNRAKKRPAAVRATRRSADNRDCSYDRCRAEVVTTMTLVSHAVER